jgi:AraC-like DNA-binding protein
MVEHFDEHYTTMDLSTRFHFSATSLKQWFRIIYGSSMYAYLKRCRMEIARALLLRTDYSVLQVALYVGYENPSKFSSAFRDETGMTPKQYRLSQTDLRQIRPAN